jgi:serine phosphatase RsbU (regulator of sigma subunit)
MDIAIIAVTPLQEVENMNQVKIEYAGAINPLHYTNPDSELQVIKANKIFIGDEIRDTDKFTNHTLFAQKGQVFYLCSDGYQDQFGGKDDKKFRIQTLRGLLTEISPKQMQEQKEILGNTFDAWKGEKEQTDDVLVVGVKI